MLHTNIGTSLNYRLVRKEELKGSQSVRNHSILDVCEDFERKHNAATSLYKQPIELFTIRTLTVGIGISPIQSSRKPRTN